MSNSQNHKNNKPHQLRHHNNNVFWIFYKLEKEYQLNKIDLSSIFVNNLEENTTEEDLKEYFKDCGVIEKITIRNDKMTSLLYSYIQF